MNLRQYTGARPLLQMAAQGRTADLISGRFQTAPRRALSEKLTQGGQHPNRRRSGMAATLLRRGRAEIDNCRDEVQKPKIQHLLPCLTPQTWSFQTDNAPHQGCITAIPSNPSARDPTTHGISGNCLLAFTENPIAFLCPGHGRQEARSPLTISAAMEPNSVKGEGRPEPRSVEASGSSPDERKRLSPCHAHLSAFRAPGTLLRALAC